MVINFDGMTLKEIVEVAEKSAIKYHLVKSGWNQTQVCVDLEMSRTTLNKKIKEYGLRDENQN